MARRKVLKITPVLITLNVLILILIAGFYTARLIKYYRLENGHRGEDGLALLSEVLEKKRSYLDETKGLVYNEENNTYRFKGEVEDNYIYYSGLLYRIIGLDSERNIKAVCEENVTLIYPNFYKGYEKSYVNKWLNKTNDKYSGIFENTLVESEKLLVNTSMCSDKIDDLSKITCEEDYQNSKITLLSLYDYKEAGGKDSYLNNGTKFNLGSLNGKNYSYFITSEGEIGLNKPNDILKTNDDMLISVKPVITFTSATELIKGNGKIDNPYIVEEHKIETLSDTYVGNYIKINDTNYRIMSVSDSKVKVVSTGVIMKDEKTKLSYAFGGSNNTYSTSKGTVGAYLNSTYLNSLDVKKYVTKGDFYVGLLSLTNKDYATLYNSKVSAKVGMVTLGDFFIEGVNNVLTILRSYDNNSLINVINKSGGLYANTISSKYNVRPVLYLKGDTSILSGDGSEDDPYEIGEKDEAGQEKQEKDK